MFLNEYEKKKREILAQLDSLENQLQKKELKLATQETLWITAIEDRLRAIENKIKRLNEIEKYAIEPTYVIEFEDGTTKELTKKEIEELADTTSHDVGSIQPIIWAVGKKVKAKGKVGVIKKKIKQKGYIIQFEDGETEEVDEKELEESNIIPLKPFLPSESKVYNGIESIIKELNPNEANVYFVEERPKGIRLLLHKAGKNIELFLSNKENVTDKYPDIVKQAPNLTAEDIILDGVLIGNKYKVFDILYYKNQSLDDIRLYERKKVLNLLEFTENIVKSPFVVVNSSDQMIKAVKLFRALPTSDGVLIRGYNSTYKLGFNQFWSVFSLEAQSKLFKPYLPMKPHGSAYYDLKECINDLQNGKKYSFEFKYNGFHAVAHKKGEEVKIFSEQKKDISSAFPTLMENIKKLAPNHDFIVDGEIVPYSPEGKALGRDPLMKFIGAVKSGKKLDDSLIKMHVFDITYFDKPIIEKPLHERQLVLDKLKFNDRVERVLYKIGTKENAEKLINWATRQDGSEGCVIKDLDSPYVFGEKSKAWIKFRHLVDIHAVVLKKVEKERNLFNYLVGIYVSQEDAKKLHPDYIQDFNGKKVLVLGHTFNTSEEVSLGTIIDVALEDVWRHTYPEIGKVRYSIHKPRFRQTRPDLKETSSIQDLEDIVTSIGEEVIVENEEELKEKSWEDVLKKGEGEGGDFETRYEAAVKFWDANWYKSFPKSGKGVFIYHHHYRGLTEDESKMSEEELLDTDNSVHGDLRCQKDDKSLWGFTIFTGSTKDLKKAGGCRLCKLEGNEKMQGTFKLLEPLAWAKVGLKKPYVSEPEGVGATKNYYAKFFAVDHGTYDMGVWRKHSFEIFLHGKKLKGRYIIQFAPVGGRRIWLISHPEDQTPYADSHKLEDVIKELKAKKQEWLVWAKPGVKPKLIHIGD